MEISQDNFVLEIRVVIFVHVVMRAALHLNLLEELQPHAELYYSTQTQLRHVTLFLEEFSLGFSCKRIEKHFSIKLSSFLWAPMPVL